jgi:hypothetical protein
MEGGFYYADCTISGSTYELILRGNPKIQVQGDNLEGVKESLYEAIIDWNGDGEPQVEIIFEDSKDWFLLGASDSVEIKNIDTLHSGGVCPSCSFSVGARSTEVMELNEKPKGGLCRAESKVEWFTLIRKSLADKLLKLTDVGLLFRETLYRGEDSGYLELLSPPETKYVLPINVEVNESYRTTFHCTACGRDSFTGNHAIDKRYFDDTAFTGKGIVVVKPNALKVNELLINGKLLGKNFKRTKVERFSTTKVDLLKQGEFYIPTNLKKVDHIDWS